MIATPTTTTQPVVVVSRRIEFINLAETAGDQLTKKLKRFHQIISDEREQEYAQISAALARPQVSDEGRSGEISPRRRASALA